MDINAAVLGIIEDLFRQYLAVGDNDNKLGLNAFKHFERRAVPHLGRLNNGNAHFERKLLDGRGGEHAVPALGLIGLSEYSADLAAAVKKPLKAGHRKIGGAHKYRSHQTFSLLKTLWVKRIPSRWSISWQKQRALRASPL